MNRIDPAKVPDVYRKLGLKPVSGVFVGEPSFGECCVLSAIYCESKGCTEASECLAEIKESSNQDGHGNPFDVVAFCDDDDYPWGVIYGWDFDEGDPDPEPNVYSPDYILGFQDGRAAKAAVLESGLVVKHMADGPDEDEDVDYDDDFVVMDYEDEDDDEE